MKKNASVAIVLCLLFAVVLPNCKQTPLRRGTGSTVIDGYVVIPPYDQNLKVDPATVPFTTETHVIKGHTYVIDVVTSPTRSVAVDNTKPTMPLEEKLSKMYWTVQPALGLIEGEYWQKKGYFNYNPESISLTGHIAVAEVVRKDGNIVLVELNEIASLDYYDPRYHGMPKIQSEYGFFEAESQRSDNTLVTLNNGFTFAEYLMVKENRITGDFKTVKGHSNSLYSAIFPLLNMIAEEMKGESQEYYYSFAERLPSGITPRLRVITTPKGKILEAHYDEYFADTPEEIQDVNLRKYYRTSKFGSTRYSFESDKNFREFSKALEKMIIDGQNFMSVDSILSAFPNMGEELANYKKAAGQVRYHISQNNH
jgi:hypothetical protein